MRSGFYHEELQNHFSGSGPRIFFFFFNGINKGRREYDRKYQDAPSVGFGELISGRGHEVIEILNPGSESGLDSAGNPAQDGSSGEAARC